MSCSSNPGGHFSGFADMSPLIFGLLACFDAPTEFGPQPGRVFCVSSRFVRVMRLVQNEHWTQTNTPKYPREHLFERVKRPQKQLSADFSSNEMLKKFFPDTTPDAQFRRITLGYLPEVPRIIMWAKVQINTRGEASVLDARP